ncbi:MAG: hypothetical protein CSA54_04355 [Gammaproteobacteria bacterium]|nr:MAG: hypothetical protein CSA54_04355 [Gammaproteobacteria bacterium]
MVDPEHQLRIHRDENIATAFSIIREKRSRFLPVINDDGSYVGVFSAPTLLKLILPRAVTIDMVRDNSRLHLSHLQFMRLTRADFHAQLDHLKNEKVSDHLSNPDNIPVAAPDTPVMEGIFMIYKFKRHLMLVDPDNQQFVGSVSPNSLLANVLG